MTNKSVVCVKAYRLSLDPHRHRRIDTMIAQALLILSFAPAVFAGCCTPPQWEGQEGIFGGYARFIGKPRLNGEFFNVSYDGINEQVAVAGHAFFRDGDNKMSTFKMIFNYKKKTGYFVDLEKMSCKAFGLRYGFKNACIPDSAKELGSTYFGAGGNSLEVTSYFMGYKGKSADLHASITVTSNGCIPVSEALFGHVTKKWWFIPRTTYFYETVGFTGITPGIANPDVFTPPDFCKSESVEQPEYLDEEFRHNYKLFHF